MCTDPHLHQTIHFLRKDVILFNTEPLIINKVFSTVGN